MLKDLGTPVVPQQFPSECFPNRGILCRAWRRGLAWPPDRQTPSGSCVSCSGSSRRLPPTPCSRSSTSHTPPCGRRTSPTSASRSGRGYGLQASPAFPSSGSRRKPQTPGQVLVEPFPGRGHSVHRAAVGAAPARQSTHDYPLFVEDIEVAPLHRFNVVVAGHRGSGARTLLRPQFRRLLYLQLKHRSFKPVLHDAPSLTQTKQLSKLLLKCHRQESSATCQTTPSHRKQGRTDVVNI